MCQVCGLPWNGFLKEDSKMRSKKTIEWFSEEKIKPLFSAFCKQPKKKQQVLDLCGPRGREGLMPSDLNVKRWEDHVVGRQTPPPRIPPNTLQRKDVHPPHGSISRRKLDLRGARRWVERSLQCCPSVKQSPGTQGAHYLDNSIKILSHVPHLPWCYANHELLQLRHSLGETEREVLMKWDCFHLPFLPWSGLKCRVLGELNRCWVCGKRFIHPMTC